MPFTLSKLLDDILLLRQKKKEAVKRTFNLWASDLGGCPRKLKLRQLDYSKLPLSIDSLNSFERGNSLHLWLTDLLKSADAKELLPSIEILDEEWMESENREIIGRIDLLLKPTPEELYLYEIKSMDKLGIKYIQNKSIWETRRKDVLQLLSYYYNLIGQNKKINGIRLYIISEDLSWKLEFGIEPSRYEKEYQAELAKCQEIIKSPDIPKAEFCYMCYHKRFGKIYCQYIPHCLKNLGISLDESKTKVKEIEYKKKGV